MPCCNFEVESKTGGLEDARDKSGQIRDDRIWPHAYGCLNRQQVGNRIWPTPFPPPMSSTEANTAGGSAAASNGERLDSWKEIATYLKCSERTVRRWESEGLPVHRHPHSKKSSIYAYKPEIDVWWRNGHKRLERISSDVRARQPALVRFSYRSWKPLSLTFLALLIGLATAQHFWRSETQTPKWHPAAALHIESIAVLPLENLSHDSDQDYFADGMTEELITELSKIAALRVISRTSVMQYKGTRKTVSEIARELKVDAVVEGSVARSENRVRITAQLVHAPTDTNLWAENFERDEEDVLLLQNEVARDIASEIQVKLTPQEETRLANARPVNAEAHELYLKGRYYWNKRTPDALKKSLEYFQSAVAKDPNYALGYAGMADAYAMLGASSYMVLPAKQAYPKAEAAAMKALRLDSTLAEAHTCLAWSKFVFDWDWRGAEREYKQAIELNPGYANAHHWYAHNLSIMGRHTEAIAEDRKAESLDPLSLVTIVDVGLEAFRPAGRYDEEMEQCRKALEMDPNFALAHACLADSYYNKRMHKEAIAEMQRAIQLSGGSAPYVASLAILYLQADRRDEAIRILNELVARSKREFIPPQAFMYIYAQLGDKERAFSYLEKAYHERYDVITGLKVDPLLQPLRSDPRFQDLVRRVELRQ